MSRTLRSTLLHRHGVVWLLVLLAVFGALAPTVSHALVAARGNASPWLAICSSAGPRSLAPSDAAGTSGGDESASLREACPFCLLNAERAAPPPTAQVHHFAATGAMGAPSCWRTAVVASPHVLAAQPRGPLGSIILFLAA